MRSSDMQRYLKMAVKLARVMRVRRWRRALRAGVAAGVEHAHILSTMVGCRTVVDIGANRGQFALAAREVFPDADIISFEPLSIAAKKYREVFAEDAGARLHEAAIGPTAGSATLCVSGRDDSSSFLPISERQSTLFPGTAQVGVVNAEMGPLTQYVARTDIRGPALLKLDVQGFELQALHGCEALLPEFSWVYAECSFVELYVGQALASQLIAWLRDHGFILGGIYNAVYDAQGRAVQADFLFTR